MNDELKADMASDARVVLEAAKYAGPPGPCPHCDLEVGFVCPDCGLRVHASDLARAVLADLAERERVEAERALPIDCPWLCTLGFKFVKGEREEHCGGWVLCLVDFEIDEERGMYGEELRLCDGGTSGLWCVEIRSRARDWSEGVGLATYSNRGQVLDLLAALGIRKDGA